MAGECCPSTASHSTAEGAPASAWGFGRLHPRLYGLWRFQPWRLSLPAGSPWKGVSLLSFFLDCLRNSGLFYLSRAAVCNENCGKCIGYAKSRFRTGRQCAKCIGYAKSRFRTGRQCANGNGIVRKFRNCAKRKTIGFKKSNFLSVNYMLSIYVCTQLNIHW